jgi:sugar phosphate isomerase/epimerase
MPVRLSCSEITTSTASFADDVRAYSGAGFDAIGIWESKLPAQDRRNVALLEEHGLAVSNCVPAVSSILPLALPGMKGPTDLGLRMRALCRSIERLAVYHPESVVFLTGPAGALVHRDVRELVVAALPQLAATAEAAGVRLGLEPVHPSQHDEVSFVTSLVEAERLLACAQTDGIGIHFDTYHAWDDLDAVPWLARNARRITGVHVCDWPRDRTDPGRVLPGEGGSRSRDLVAALQAAGWTGSLDVEVFSRADRFTKANPESVARYALAAAQTLIS